jgi:4-hydroxybenzoate polyprenyltransferase
MIPGGEMFFKPHSSRGITATLFIVAVSFGTIALVSMLSTIRNSTDLVTSLVLLGVALFLLGIAFDSFVGLQEMEEDE